MTGERKKCEACGIFFEQRPSTLGKFCDAACKKRGQVKMRTVMCAGCGKPLRRHASELKRTGSSVCDRKCQTQAKAIPKDAVLSLRAQGLSQRAIAERLGCKKTKIYRILKAADEKRP